MSLNSRVCPETTLNKKGGSSAARVLYMQIVMADADFLTSAYVCGHMLTYADDQGGAGAVYIQILMADADFSSLRPHTLVG